MALVNCPECGNKISDQAKSCPNCGFVILEKIENGSVEPKPIVQKTNQVPANSTGCLTALAPIIILGGIVSAVLIFALSSGREGDAQIGCENLVKRKLKSPATATFPSLDEKFVTILPDKTYKVDSYVDAENSFGAKIRNSYTCTIQDNNEGQWILKHLSIESQ